jgi:hypothetical protein
MSDAPTGFTGEEWSYLDDDELSCWDDGTAGFLLLRLARARMARDGAEDMGTKATLARYEIKERYDAALTAAGYRLVPGEDE